MSTFCAFLGWVVNARICFTLSPSHLWDLHKEEQINRKGFMAYWNGWNQKHLEKPKQTVRKGLSRPNERE